jgi:hypothetical protein
LVGKTSAQIPCVRYAQDLADKLSRDCRQIVASGWHRQVFAARVKFTDVIEVLGASAAPQPAA